MSFHKFFQFLVILGVALLLAFGPQPIQSAAPSVAEPDVAVRMGQHPPTPAEDLAAYVVQPLLNAAQSTGGPSYQAHNPAQGLKFVFAATQIEVTSAREGGQPWQIVMRLEDDHVTAAGETGATTVEVTGNRLQYTHAQSSEWFINGREGLKHGFTLYQRPTTHPTTDAVRLHLQVDGTLQPKVSHDQQAVDFVTASGVAYLRYDSLAVFDANEQAVPAYFAQSATGIIIVIEDQNATYPLTVDPLLTNYLAKRTMIDGASADFLGNDVNIFGNTVVVGAYGDDTEKGIDTGSAFLYERHQGGVDRWNPIVELQAADGAAGDEFGRDTYITAAQTVIVGAPGNDEKGSDAGAAYIFARNQGGPNGWGQEAKLTASDAAANDRFGSIVSVQANTAVVGLPNDDRNGAGSGAVYIFERVSVTPAVWSQIKVLTPADGQAGDSFGQALVISEDTLFVSAPKDDDACTADASCDSGAVYIFERNIGGTENWGLLKKVTAADAAAGDTFGSAVAYSDDRVIIGAPTEDEKGSNAGAIYIFERNFGGPSQWNQRRKVVASDGAANDQFGYAVGIGGEIAIVGAPFDQDHGPDSGSAYVLYRSAGGGHQWGEMTKVLASDGASGDGFGQAVDQRSGNAVIGAYRHDEKGSDAGALYFYRIPFTIGKLQVITQVEPADPNPQWQVTINGLVTITDTLNGNDQTDAVTVFSGRYSITARTSGDTDPHKYSTTWHCLINGNPGPAGSGITFTIDIGIDETAVCTFRNTPPTATGSILITKESAPSGGAGFSFTDTITPAHTFTLNDGGQQSFTNIAPGTYQVTEGVTAGWNLTGIHCVDPDDGTTSSGAIATIDLDAGETVFCTFSNTATLAQIGTIVIKKQSRPAGGAGFTFTQSITTPTSFTLGDGDNKVFSNVPADVYEVTEVPVTGWTLATATCTDPDKGSSVSGATASIDLDAGETITCTFANEQVTGQNNVQLFLPLVIR